MDEELRKLFPGLGGPGDEQEADPFANIQAVFPGLQAPDPETPSEVFDRKEREAIELRRGQLEDEPLLSKVGRNVSRLRQRLGQTVARLRGDDGLPAAPETNVPLSPEFLQGAEQVPGAGAFGTQDLSQAQGVLPQAPTAPSPEALLPQVDTGAQFAPEVIPDTPVSQASIGAAAPSEIDIALAATAQQEAAQEAFAAQPKPKRLLQAATTGLRNAPGILGAFGRAVKPDDTLVETLIENDIINLTTGERGFEIAGTFAPPVVEILLTKKMARAIAPKLTGRAGELANLVGRTGAGSRAGGTVTGVLEGVPTDLVSSIENGDLTDLGIGTGIGAITGFLFPGGGAIGEELAEAIAKNPKDVTEQLVDLAGDAIRAGDDELPSQMEVALARAFENGDQQTVQVLDDALDRLPNAADIAEQGGVAERRAAADVEPEVSRIIPAQDVSPIPRPIEVETPPQGRTPDVQASREADRIPAEPSVGDARPVTSGGQVAAPDQARFIAGPEGVEVRPQDAVGDSPVEVREADIMAGSTGAVDPDFVRQGQDAIEWKRQRVAARGDASNPEIVESVRRYAEDPNTTPEALPEVPADAVMTSKDDLIPAFHENVAEVFARATSTPDAPEVRAAYDALTKEVDDQFRQMTEVDGVRVEFVDTDPYPNSAAMLRDVAENKRMKVFKTSGDDPNPHPIMSDETNERFRAAHDYFGHAKSGVPFSGWGEEAAYRNHRIMFSDEAGKAMATETRGQNSWFNYGPNKETPAPQRPFAEQKVFILPESMRGIDYEGTPLRTPANAAIDIVDSAFRTPAGDVIVAPRPEGAATDLIRPHATHLDDLPLRDRVEASRGESGFIDEQGNFVTRDESFARTGRRSTEEFGERVELRETGEVGGLRGVDADEEPVDFDAIFREFAGEAGAINPALLRAVAAPAVGGTVGAVAGAATSLDPQDSAGRAKLGATLGILVGLGPAGVRALDKNSALFRKYFTPGGVLPGTVKGMDRELTKGVRSALARLRGNAGEADRIIAQSLADVGAATKKLYGGPGRVAVVAGDANPFEAIPPDVMQQVSRFMNGEQGALRQLPEELRTPLAAMRDQVDRYSKMFLKEGIVEGELAVTFNERLGTHLTRSYRVFDDPNWAENAPKILGDTEWNVIKNDFKKWYRAEVAGASDDEMDRIFADFMAVGDEGNPLRFIKSGKLGKLNSKVLARRKEIPLEVRKLWGEHDDPGLQFARTITNQAFFVSNYKFLRELGEIGEDNLFFRPQVEDSRVVNLADRPESFTHELGPKMGPLAGFRTSPELGRALEEQFAGTQRLDNVFIRGILRMMSASKVSKTILSQVTQVRNLVGNAAFAVAQGHAFEPLAFGRAGKQAIGGLIEGAGLRPGTQYREWFNKMTRLGVVDDSARAEELKQALDSIARKPMADWMNLPVVGRVAKGVRTLKNTTFGAYRAEDDVWKLIGFGVERERYAKALPNASEAELDDLASQVVRDTWPTFSQTPEIINQARRVGGFLSFPAEVFRTIHGTLSTIERELADPALRPIAMKRIAGMAIGAATGSAATAAASRKLFNVTKDEEDAIREFQPPWSENSQFVHLAQPGDGKFTVWDASYTDPYSYMRGPFTAFLRGENWREALTSTLSEVGSPWLTANPLTSELVEAIQNTDETENAGALVAEHMAQALTPGIVDQWTRAISGRSSSLREVDRQGELVALATGQRFEEKDIRESLKINFSQFNLRFGRAGRQLRQAEARGGVASRLGDQERAFGRLEERTLETKVDILEDMARKAKAAETLGLTRREIDSMMKAGKMSAENRKFVWQIVGQGV